MTDLTAIDILITEFVVQPSPQVLDFQAALIAAMNPYVESGGTPRPSSCRRGHHQMIN